MDRYVFGEDFDAEFYWDSLGELIPAAHVLRNLPPTLKAYIGYVYNKDFWTNDEVWKGGRMTSPTEEYTHYTAPAYVKGVKALKEALPEPLQVELSPTRLKHALQQIFTQSNLYTDIGGYGITLLTEGLNEESKDKIMEKVGNYPPVVRRIYKKTSPYEPWRKGVEETKAIERTRKAKQKNALYKLFEDYYEKIEKTGVEDTALANQITSFIMEQPPIEQKALFKRFQTYGQLYHIPDKRWWVNLMYSNPEVRAYIFFVRWKDSNTEDRKKLQQGLFTVPRIFTKRFKSELFSLIAAGGLEWEK